MDKLYFGTGGIPLCTEPRDTENGIRATKQLGLGSMELEFVRNVNISSEKAPLIKRVSQEAGVKLTAHASYFINLNSPEDEKRAASRQRLFAAANALNSCGGYSVCVHAAYRLDSSKEQVYSRVKKEIGHVVQDCKDHGIKVWIRPETAGKHAQFGTLEELVQFSSEFDQVLPCIDFSHIRATTNGRVNSYEEYCKALDLVEKGLGKNALKEMHLHIQGVNYGDKGEKNHLAIKDDPFWNYKDLMRALKGYGVAGCVTCESPVLEEDALILKKYYGSL